MFNSCNDRVKVMSHEEYPVLPDLEVKGAAFDFMSIYDEMIQWVDTTPDDVYLHPFNTDVPVGIEKAFQEVIDNPFEPIATPTIQTQVSKGCAAVIISAINVEVARAPTGPVVLILGGGKGADVNRLALAKCFPSKLVFSDKYKPISTLLVDHFIIGDFFSNFNKIKQHGPYDIIIMTMSVQYWVGDKRSSKCRLEDLLSAHGVVLGTCWDIEGVRSLGSSDDSSYNRNIVVGRHIPDDNYFRGLVHVTVEGRSYFDPLILFSDFTRAFSSNVTCDVLPARYALFSSFTTSPIYPVPPHLFEQANIPVVRHVLLVVARKRTVYVPSFISYVPTFVPVPNPAPFPLVLRNKGRCLIGTDFPYLLTTKLVYAKKLDGIGGILHCANHGMTLFLDDGRQFYFKVKMSLQFIGDIYEIEFFSLSKVFIFDLARSPVAGRTFAMRWAHVGDFFRVFPFFFLQTYSTEPPPLTDVEEGLVIQSLATMPGSFQKGYGSARYVKRQVTADLKHEGAIYRATFVADKWVPFGKPRSDKKTPNNHTTLWYLRHAVSLSDFYYWHNVQPFIAPIIKEFTTTNRVDYETIPITSMLSFYKYLSSEQYCGDKEYDFFKFSYERWMTKDAPIDITIVPDVPKVPYDPYETYTEEMFG